MHKYRLALKEHAVLYTNRILNNGEKLIWIQD